LGYSTGLWLPEFWISICYSILYLVIFLTLTFTNKLCWSMLPVHLCVTDLWCRPWTPWLPPRQRPSQPSPWWTPTGSWRRSTSMNSGTHTHGSGWRSFISVFVSPFKFFNRSYVLIAFKSLLKISGSLVDVNYDHNTKKYVDKLF